MKRNCRTAVHLLLIIAAVASLTLMSPGAVTNGVTLFFPQKVMTFLVFVTTLHPHRLTSIVCRVLFVNSAAKKIRLSLGCHP